MNPSEILNEKDASPKVHYLPYDEYEETLLQYSTLKTMGYPVTIEIINNDDPRMADYCSGDDEYEEWEVRTHPRWAIVTADPTFEKLVECLDCPGDITWSDDAEVQDLLQEHPVQVIYDIQMGDVGMAVAKYRWYLESDDIHFRMKHLREDFPWDDFLQKCIVAAGDRYTKLVKAGAPGRLLHSPEHALSTYYELRKHISPINGEQLAGLIEDYYRMVESANPEFLALRK